MLCHRIFRSSLDTMVSPAVTMVACEQASSLPRAAIPPFVRGHICSAAAFTRLAVDRCTNCWTTLAFHCLEYAVEPASSLILGISCSSEVSVLDAPLLSCHSDVPYFDFLLQTLPDDLCPRMIISSTRARSPDDLDPTWYPVNRLRNVAIRAVTTSHFLMTDIDIWPDVNAYNALHMRHRFEREK